MDVLAPSRRTVLPRRKIRPERLRGHRGEPARPRRLRRPESIIGCRLFACRQNLFARRQESESGATAASPAAGPAPAEPNRLPRKKIGRGTHSPAPTIM
ncbi:hypothetical protein FMEAI12_3960016 [Parafrankia sp. Ea1.12]|nr:hypothetical protein FMEAI12_3960016 [Parafrankia sp. Ea1.12]